MKHSLDQGGCYPQRPKTEVDNTHRDQQNASCPTKAGFNNCFISHSKYIPFLRAPFHSLFFRSQKYNTRSSSGFLGQRFNNLQRGALVTSF